MSDKASGLAKNIGHDAVERFTRQVSGVLERSQTQLLHQCIRAAVDEHLATRQAMRICRCGRWLSAYDVGWDTCIHCYKDNRK